MDNAFRESLLAYLLGFISENKSTKFKQLIQYRTRHLTVVLEDIFQPHNASAVLRTCDCFGIQDVHIIENRNKYTVNPDVALGSARWITLIKHNRLENNTYHCLKQLKDNGYKLVAASPHQEDCKLEEYPLNERTALLFGTELHGLSQVAMDMTDATIHIPMVGFTESFNISVSVAICLYELTRRLRNSELPWQLSETEKTDVMIEWAKRVIKKPELLEKEFLKTWSKKM